MAFDTIVEIEMGITVIYMLGIITLIMGFVIADNKEPLNITPTIGRRIIRSVCGLLIIITSSITGGFISYLFCINYNVTILPLSTVSSGFYYIAIGGIVGMMVGCISVIIITIPVVEDKVETS